MKFEELVSNSVSNILKNSNLEETYKYLYENKIPLIRLYGNYQYTILEDAGEYWLIGHNQPFNSLNSLVNYINETYDDMVEIPSYLLSEDLAYAKFRYCSKYPNKGYQIHDPKPKVLVLDNDYIYNGKGKVVEGQHDVLAINLNYSKEKRLDRQSVDEITTFAHMLKKDKLDIYERIKAWRPEVIKYIRHYKPERMTKLKKKQGWFWRQCSVADLKGDEDWAL